MSRARLRAEFAAVYVGVPVAAALLLPGGWLFPVLFALTAVGLGLLHVTPGFHWRELTRGRGRIGWGRVAAFGAATAAVSAALVLSLRPDAWLMPGRESPALLLAILALYPLLSALPQEVIFRPLFFRRYGPVLPGGRAALALNAGVFALAHLMYWSWVVAALTFAGGLAFAHAYAVRGSFPEAVALHAVAGGVLFALGMGAWFYTGNVVRPF